VYLEQGHPLYYIPIFPSFSLFQTMFGGFHYADIICKYVASIHSLHPQVSFPSPFPFNLIPHKTVPFYIILNNNNNVPLLLLLLLSSPLF
jgi:hypothetical protein